MSVGSKVGRRGRDRFSFEQDREIREWCRSNGVTEDQMRDAVKEVQDFMAALEMLVEDGNARMPTRATRARHGGERATAIGREGATAVRRERPRYSAGHVRSHRGT